MKKRIDEIKRLIESHITALGEGEIEIESALWPAIEQQLTTLAEEVRAEERDRPITLEKMSYLRKATNNQCQFCGGTGLGVYRTIEGE